MGNLASVIVVGPEKIDAGLRDLAISVGIRKAKNDPNVLWWAEGNELSDEESVTNVVDDFIHAWNNAHEYRDINLRQYGDKVIFVAGGDDDNIYADGGFNAISKADELGILGLFGLE
jgi:hypothetical protein